MSDELVNDPRPLLPRGHWFKVVVVAAVVLAAAVLVHRAARDDRSAPDSTATAVATTARGGLTAGLFLAGSEAPDTTSFSYAAGAAVRVLVLQSRSHGSIGHRSAVITYPVAPSDDSSPPARTVEIGLHGAVARVRGDLGRRELTRIALAVRIVDGRPTVEGLTGYAVASRGAYGGCQLLESRYDTTEIGFAKWFGDGFVYTVTTDCGGIEDVLAVDGASRGPDVYTRPSALSVRGGTTTLTWRVSPGLYGIVGYSGTDTSGPRLEILASIAKETRTYGAQDWYGTHPGNATIDDLARWAD